MRTNQEIRERLTKLGGRINQQGEDGIMGNIFGKGVFIFSFGGGWEHLSISFAERLPSYDEMCNAKQVFFQDEEWAVEFHPAKSQYVNLFPYCLHIWRPLNEKLPTPPKHFVGV